MSNKPSVRKKPTNKEMASAIIEMNQRVESVTQGLHQAFDLLRQMDIVVGMYVEMNKHTEKLNKYIEFKREEAEKLNDTKKDGNADKPDIQGDTDGESSRSKRIRKKK